MKKRCFTIVMIVIFAMFLSNLTTFAKELSILDGKVLITDTKNTVTGNEAECKITVSSIGIKSTNNIAISNETDTEATITFEYSVSGHTEFSIGGESISTSGTATGSRSVVLAGKTQLDIVLATKGGSIISKKTATLTLSNITYSEVAESSQIKYEFDSTLGSVTAGGAAISSGTVLEVDKTGIEMVATPVSGATFIAWVNDKGEIVWKDSSYTQGSTGDGTVTAIFSKNTPYFLVDNKVVYDNLTDAVNAGGQKVVLMCNGTLPAGEYTIPVGVTLLIPFDDNNTLYTEKPGSVETYTKPSVYRTLTMASEAKIFVNGAISVSAMQSARINYHGATTGKYGVIVMNDKSAITVNDGGKLYTWGYIAGAGSVTAKSGATIYESFQETDYRGGQATSDMVDNKYKVFPMSQYYVQNIQVPLTLEYGAVENGYMSVFVTALGIQEVPIPFIGPSGMFRIASGSITKDYEEGTDRLIIDINGELNMAELSITMNLGLLIGNQTVNSKNYVLPINGNITLNVNTGSKVNISQDIALLPGGVINVSEGAECVFTSNAKAYIYDSAEWGGYCSASNKKVMPVNYAHARQYTRTEANLIDAEVIVNGTVNALGGAVYATASGANIHGEEEGGIIMIKPEYEITATHQVVQNDTKISGYAEIPVTNVKPKNADGSSLELSECCSTYKYISGVWTPQDENHTEVVTPATAPTCTESGLSESSYCSVCNAVLKKQEEIPALGHDYGDFVYVDKVNHKKVCANDPSHIESGAHTFIGLQCSGCGCEKIATDTQYTIGSEEITINTSLVLDVDAITKIIITTYDEHGRLLSASIKAPDTLEEVTFPAEGVKMIQIFTWNGFDVLSPVSGVEKIEL